ncbi:MAG: DUF433 domain-containing protein [Candidatus Kapabacteria bacterium]|nr:DUF433 domain-containing protein [Ignavibacteriota bacterium]MCW5883609.1 DUF433 domain-containing protein [Candidatus Kapabacteria bacterium]
MLNYNNHIEIKPDIRFGKPVIKGTRISVSDILSMLADNMCISEIIEDFPQLKSDDIKACLQYASFNERIVAYAV